MFLQYTYFLVHRTKKREVMSAIAADHSLGVDFLGTIWALHLNPLKK
jgi:hypothetical protein